MKLQINHLQHIGLPVTDLAHSKTFYARLGFESMMESTFRHEGAEGKVSMMKLGAIVLELYQMPEPELSKVRARKDGRIDHLAFDVDDVEATYRLLKDAGFSMLEPAPVYLGFWENGCKYFNISGPDGERLEFNQIL